MAAMIHVLEISLSPITWLMQVLLNFYVSLVSSTGVSIILVSFTFALLLLPIRKWTYRKEERINRKIKIVNSEVQALKGKLKGEELFLATEKIYKNHHYHPIHSVGMSASFLVMLPVLISAILLFSGNGILTGKSFLYIGDLSKPDGLLGSVNLLPLLMSAIALIDAQLLFKDDKQSRYRFFFITLVLLLLVYNSSSGLVLYWTGSNLMSLVLSQLLASKHHENPSVQDKNKSL